MDRDSYILLKTIIVFYSLKQNDSLNVSCTVLRNRGSTMSLKSVSCLNVANGICQFVTSFLPVLISNQSLILNDSIAGFFDHPMNSVTACLAYCAAKDGVLSVLVKSTVCVCSKSKSSFALQRILQPPFLLKGYPLGVCNFEFQIYWQF